MDPEAVNGLNYSKYIQCGVCDLELKDDYEMSWHQYKAHGDDTEIKKWRLHCTLCKFKHYSQNNAKYHAKNAHCKGEGISVPFYKYYDDQFKGAFKIVTKGASDSSKATNEKQSQESNEESNLSENSQKGVKQDDPKLNWLLNVLEGSEDAAESDIVDKATSNDPKMDWLVNVLESSSDKQAESGINETITLEVCSEDEQNQNFEEHVEDNLIEIENNEDDDPDYNVEKSQDEEDEISDEEVFQAKRKKYIKKKGSDKKKKSSITSFKNHLKSHKDMSNNPKTYISSKRNSQDELKAQIKPTYGCGICGITVINKNNLADHVATHAEAFKNPQLKVTFSVFKDGECVRNFEVKHRAPLPKDIEPKAPQKKNPVNPFYDESGIPKKNVYYKCEPCQLILKDEQTLNVHTRQHARVARNTDIEVTYSEFKNGKFVQEVNFKPKLKNYKKSQSYKCNQCKFQVKNHALQTHANFHSTSEGIPNLEVSFTYFLDEKSVGTVIIEANENADTKLYTYPLSFYECTLCNERFGLLLLRHINHHAKELNDPELNVTFLEYRNKKFAGKFVKQARLTDHELSLLNRKRKTLDPDMVLDGLEDTLTFKCSDCNFRSGTEEDLNVHKNIHWTEEKDIAFKTANKFYCTMCKFTCFSPELLKKHYKEHQKYEEYGLAVN